MRIDFYKMSGAGNDFILIERGKNIKKRDLTALSLKLCERRLSVGADGLISVEKKNERLVVFSFFNPDGSRAFCGNGLRCCAWWAYRHGMVKNKKFAIKTAKGELKVEIISKGQVKAEMPEVKNMKLNYKAGFSDFAEKLHFLNTGVPHAVIESGNLNNLNIIEKGREIRYHKAFGKEGTNVDFVSFKKGKLFIRTYERGVEGETLACGTGITASCVAFGIKHNLQKPVICLSRSKEKFKVWFSAKGDKVFNIKILGPAKEVFKGSIEI